MMGDTSPRRLLDDDTAPECLRQALDVAQADLPSAEVLARLGARLDAIPEALPADPGAIPSLTAGTSPALASLKLKLLAGLGLLGGSALLFYGLTRPADPDPLPTTSERAPAGDARTPNTQTSNPSSPSGAQSPEQPVKGGAEPAPTAPDTGDPPVKGEGDPAERAGDGGPQRRAETPAKPSLTEEELLRQAQTALRGDPARALSMSERHRREFPRGVLGQEREVITIQALAALGRHAEARRLALAFEKRFPNSAHRNKLRSIARAP